MKLRKRKAETLMEFLIAMSVAGMIFIMISLALQRSTSSVAKIYAQDTLRAAAKRYIADLPNNSVSDLKTEMDKRLSKDVLYDIVTFSADLQGGNNTEQLGSLTLQVILKSNNEDLILRNITHFFNKK